MDDFSAAGMVWILIMVFVFSSGLLGHIVSEDSINSDCKNFGKFSISNKVYECKLIGISSK